MKPKQVAAFWALARRDAGLQERVVEASRQREPLAAVVKLAASKGFRFSAQELQDALAGELTEAELDAVAGGLSPAALLAASVQRLAAPGEMFAE